MSEAFEIMDDGSVRIHGVIYPKPQASDDGKVLKYNHAAQSFNFDDDQIGGAGAGDDLGDPENDQDAVTKKYLENVIASLGSGFDPKIEVINFTDEDNIVINNVDALVNGTHDKRLKIKITPETEDAALVAFTSEDGVNFDTSGDYSYSSCTFDNDNAMGTTLETRGAKIYGTNGDDRAHLTPNYNSNLIGDNGLEADVFIRDPENGDKITRVRGTGSYSEPDEDTDFFLFAFAKEAPEVLKSLKLRCRKKSGGSYIKFSGQIIVYSD